MRQKIGVSWHPLTTRFQQRKKLISKNVTNSLKWVERKSLLKAKYAYAPFVQQNLLKAERERIFLSLYAISNGEAFHWNYRPIFIFSAQPSANSPREDSKRLNSRKVTFPAVVFIFFFESTYFSLSFSRKWAFLCKCLLAYI